jgi:hypothetical protein
MKKESSISEWNEKDSCRIPAGFLFEGFQIEGTAKGMHSLDATLTLTPAHSFQNFPVARTSFGEHQRSSTTFMVPVTIQLLMAILSIPTAFRVANRHQNFGRSKHRLLLNYISYAHSHFSSRLFIPITIAEAYRSL